MAKKIAVVGGINADITGAPAHGLTLHDSNIGSVCVSCGGVARNIAQNLVRLGFEVELIAPLGNDIYADMLRQSCNSAGIGLHYAPQKPMRSGTYLCLLNGDGDMHAAVNDMAICDAVTPADIDLTPILEADAVVMDANLPESVIFMVATSAKCPVIADPVSAAKCKKLNKILHRLYAIKPNLIEAQALTGETAPAKAAARLRQLGVGNVFISLGADGMYFASEGCTGSTSVEQVPMLNATGAGDSATAAIAAGLLSGKNAANTATLACCCAALTIQSKSAVSELLTADIIWR